MKASETMAASEFRPRDFLTENVGRSEGDELDDCEGEYPNSANFWI